MKSIRLHVIDYHLTGYSVNFQPLRFSWMSNGYGLFGLAREPC